MTLYDNAHDPRMLMKNFLSTYEYIGDIRAAEQVLLHLHLINADGFFDQELQEFTQWIHNFNLNYRMMDNQPHIVVHGNYIAHVNNYNDYNEHGRQQTQLGVCRTNDGTVEKGALGYLNENLATDRAKAELAKYQKEGILDEFYQPINLTRPQMGCIVIKIGDLLGLESQWKDFGCLWNIDSELLRTQFGRGKDSEPTRRFYKRIYDI